MKLPRANQAIKSSCSGPTGRNSLLTIGNDYKQSYSLANNKIMTHGETTHAFGEVCSGSRLARSVTGRRATSCQAVLRQLRFVLACIRHCIRPGTRSLHTNTGHRSIYTASTPKI